MRLRQLAALGAAIVLAACATAPTGSAQATIKVGALFPLTGLQAPLAKQQYAGVQIARDFINADGGVDGVPVTLLTKDLTQPTDAGTRVRELQGQGVRTILGAYSSSISMAVSAASQSRGILYWEAGAVADQLTGRGYPLVFRVGATGSNLGTMASHFAAQVLAPRLSAAPSDLRMVIVHNVDGYPTSVATAVEQEARRNGITVAGNVVYDAHVPDWASVLSQVRASRPNLLVLASYIADGVDFRRAMLKDGLHVDAFIGSTMAQCVPDFGAMLGADAIGVFAADRPPHGFNPTALNQTGQAIYARFAAAYRREYGTDPTEESLSGFAAAWTLFHYVLPRAGNLSASAIASAARSLDLPAGTLANGAGVKFATSADARGQNVRAASVIWQWQGVRHSVTVYPPVFATGTPGFIPLPR
ncbi:MAG TPA: ABC transporter substrate-binding protein [Candidatus Dormibacteraeota bacterium]|nr:ABC transporter substrate-binding protein [Candidatus Dormibacteraeota bacterium]